jgi:L-methionine (R)-S-oxide reductase
MPIPDPTCDATLALVRDVLAAPGGAADRLQRLVQLIHDRHPHYEWLGLYLLRGDVLELGPFVGAATEHTRIPVGVGVCGTAVAQGRNQVISDVRELSNYLACSATVRAEIVVLIRDGDRVLGQLDADCDTVGAFTRADEAFLEQVAAVIAPLVAAVAAD